MIQALKITGTGLLSKVHWHFLGKRSFSCSATKRIQPVKVYKNPGVSPLKEKIYSETALRGKSWYISLKEFD
jgi:hypothetical protein